MLATQGLVTAITLYFFIKVLRTPAKGGEEGQESNDSH